MSPDEPNNESVGNGIPAVADDEVEPNRATATDEDGAQLLDDVRAFIGRLCAMPSEQALTAVTLWAAHTHAIDLLHTSPRLALLSPEPGSGKTRVLEVLEPLVRRPMLVLNASPAAIFRSLKSEPWTLLYDEIDAVFTKRGKNEGNEELRALMNAGYRRGATIPRCVGPQHDVQRFPVFAPLALAGLGELPQTIMSRAIIVRMRKRLASERIEPFRTRIHVPAGHQLHERLAAWVQQQDPAAFTAYPDMPEGIEDRPAEVWEPLLAIADVADGHWPQTARAACIELTSRADNREASLGIQLLTDIRRVFDADDVVPTAVLLGRLYRLEEAPWNDLHGRPLGAPKLARMLRQYEVRSTKIKTEGRALQGYRREDLWDAWQRYLPATPAEPEPPEPKEPPPAIGRTTIGRANEAIDPASPAGMVAQVPQVPPVRDSSTSDAGTARLNDPGWEEVIE